MRQPNPSSVSSTASHVANWWLPGALIVAAGAIELAGSAGRELLRYERTGIGDSELWRLLSAHVTHLGPAHLALNVAGLVLVWHLAGRRLDLVAWCLSILIIALGVDAGLWFGNPDIEWYVGLSGVLHGMLVLGALAGLRTSRWESAILLVVVGAKLAYEQIAGPVPGSAVTAGGPVVIDAHFYGAVAALPCAIGWWISGRARRPL